MALLDQVLARVSHEFVENGKEKLFEELRPFLVEGSEGKSDREIGVETGPSEEAVKKTVQRMRRRYHEPFRHEIAQTVTNPTEIEDELRHLCEVLSN